jgi:hypothetical protein
MPHAQTQCTCSFASGVGHDPSRGTCDDHDLRRQWIEVSCGILVRVSWYVWFQCGRARPY